MALTAATLYECLETHKVTAGGIVVWYKRGEIKRGDAVLALSPDNLWMAAGSSDAAKLTQRASAGLSNLLPTS